MSAFKNKMNVFKIFILVYNVCFRMAVVSQILMENIDLLREEMDVDTHAEELRNGKLLTGHQFANVMLAPENKKVFRLLKAFQGDDAIIIRDGIKKIQPRLYAQVFGESSDTQKNKKRPASPLATPLPGGPKKLKPELSSSFSPALLPETLETVSPLDDILEEGGETSPSLINCKNPKKSHSVDSVPEKNDSAIVISDENDDNDGNKENLPKCFKAGSIPLSKGVKKTEGKEICKIEISKRLFVVVNKYEGTIFIHVRHYDEQGNPTKKGAALNMSRWLILEMLEKKIDASLLANSKGHQPQDLSEHLGGGYYATIENGRPYINIRKWFISDKENNTLKPTKKGVTLNVSQWEKVKWCFSVMRDFVPELLGSKVICFEGHDNQMGYHSCPECQGNIFENAENSQTDA